MTQEEISENCCKIVNGCLERLNEMTGDNLLSIRIMFGNAIFKAVEHHNDLSKGLKDIHETCEIVLNKLQEMCKDKESS